MKGSIIALITLLFIGLPFTAGTGDSGIGRTVSIDNEMGFAFDWTGWDRDLNGDRVDDVLTCSIPAGEMVDGSIGINVHLKSDPLEGDVSDLLEFANGLGFGPELIHKGKYSTAVYLRVHHQSLELYRRLASFPGVTMVEYRPWMVPFLDISTKGMRVSPSDEYSPFTASELGHDGEGVNIAVMDSGVDDIQHESLRGKFVTGGDFTGTVTVMNINPEDRDGHGTHTAGIALGSGGQSGTYAGVAPGSGLVDLKIFKVFGGDASNSDRAFEWLIENHEEHDIRVVSCSFGSTYTSSGRDTTSRLVDRLVEEGVVVVVAAGNDGSQGFPSPASADRAITVGALNDMDTVTRNDDARAGYSNYGPRSSDGDSDQMDELKPDILASGTDVRSAQYGTMMAYTEKTGTSMSCPHVSGAVALMLEANPDLSPDQVKQILRETAQVQGPSSRTDLDDRYNYRSGWGLVDAYGAVKRAKDLGSFNVMGPAEVKGGDPIDVELTGHFSRTEYTSHPDRLDMEIEVPGDWGPIEKSSLSAGALSGTTTLEDPVLIGSMWVVRGSVTYDRPVEGAEPKMTIGITSPVDVGERATVEGTVSMNGMKGSVQHLNMTVSSGADPADLSIIPMAIWFSNVRPGSGDLVEITVRVNNTGGTPVRDVPIRVVDGPARTGGLIGEKTLSIPSGGQDTITVTWEASAGVHAITAIADPEDAVEETNELNNTAEKPITVLGINPPPIADLTAEPLDANTLTDITFDGSGSYDTNVRGGAVTQYLFDFGDGEVSGWINHSTVSHRYRAGGSFRASLTVKDNGGGTSSNDAFVSVNITEQATDGTKLYLDSSGLLSEEEGAPGSLEIPATSGGTEHINTWLSPTVERSMVLHTEIVVGLEIGSEEDGSIMVNVSIFFQDEVLEMTGSVAVSAGSLSSLEMAVGAGDIVLNRGEKFSLEVSAGSTSNSSYLSTGGPGSYIDILHYPKPNDPPIVEAGRNREVKALQVVNFEGEARDGNGEIISFRWDVDGDGIYEIEGQDARSFVYDGYEEPGNYEAVFEAMDNDGEWGRDTASVLVRPADHNFPPDVWLDVENGTKMEGTVVVGGGASDDTGIVHVEIRTVPEGGSEAEEWALAEGKEAWSFELDTTRIMNGMHMLQARSYDGERYSTLDERTIEVENPNKAPEIIDHLIEPPVLPVDGITPINIYVEVFDLDMPHEVITVWADMTSLGGQAALELKDDGSGPDDVPGDLIFTNSYIPPISTRSGTYTIPVTALDGYGARDELLLTVDVENQLSVECIFSTFKPYRGGELKIDVIITPAGTDHSVRVLDMGAFEEGNVTLLDDGQEGDRVARDGTYSGKVGIVGSPGLYIVVVEVRDGKGVLLWSSPYELSVQEPPAVLSSEAGSRPPSAALLFSLAALLIVFAAVLFGILYRDRLAGMMRAKRESPLAEQGVTIDPYHDVEVVDAVLVETIDGSQQASVKSQMPEVAHRPHSAAENAQSGRL